MEATAMASQEQNFPNTNTQIEGSTEISDIVEPAPESTNSNSVASNTNCTVSKPTAKSIINSADLTPQGDGSTNAMLVKDGESYRLSKSVLGQEYSFSNPQYSSNLLKDIHQLQTEGIVCDVKLKVKDGEILAHRLVLIAASPFFKERLMLMKAEDGCIMLFIDDTDHTTLSCMVDYVYSGCLKVPSYLIQHFVKLCNHLMMPDLANLCLKWLEKEVNAENIEAENIETENRTKFCVNDQKPSKLKAKTGRKRKLQVDEQTVTKAKVGRRTRSNDNTKIAISKSNRKATSKTVKRKCKALKTPNSESFKNIKNVAASNGIIESMEIKVPSLKIKPFKDVKTDFDRSKEIDPYNEDEDTLSEHEQDSGKDIKPEKKVPLAKREKQLVRPKLKTSFSKQCNVCSEILKSVKEYSEHMKTHRKTKKAALSGQVRPKRVRRGGFPCMVCGRVLTSAVRQACHQNSKHGVPFEPHFTLHTCTHEGCNYTTASKHYLQIHTAGRHSNARPHVCEFCGKGFKLPSALITHLNIHTNAKVFECEECNLTFNQKGGLDIHIKKHHKGQESWSELCHLCSEKFLHKAELCWHLYMAHQIPVPDRYTVFSCELCDYQTIRKNKLERHMDAHDDNRSFICNVCGKKFVTKSYLNRHMKYHGEKKFKCDFEGCNYACVDHLGLRKHIRLMHTHKNYKPFLCSICPYKTGLRGNLDKHIRTVHNLEVVTKHTVHHRMRFRGHESGDIITKDGTLVQRVMDTRTPADKLACLKAGEDEEGTCNLVIHEEMAPTTKEEEGTESAKPRPPRPAQSRKKTTNRNFTTLEAVVPDTGVPVSGESATSPNNNDNSNNSSSNTTSTTVPQYQYPAAASYMLNPYPLGSQIQVPTSVMGDPRATLPPTQIPAPQSDMYLTIDPLTFKYSEYF